jgi:hypothetical protein
MGSIRTLTFFFFGQQLVYYRQTGSGALFTVPTEAFRNGDFSEYVDAAGAQIPIYDPLSTRQDSAGNVLRDQFPNNRIPSNRISATSRNILDLMPLPDIAGQQNNFRNRTGGGSYDNYVLGRHSKTRSKQEGRNALQ